MYLHLCICIFVSVYFCICVCVFVHFCTLAAILIHLREESWVEKCAPRRRKNRRSWEEGRDWAMDTQGGCIHVEALLEKYKYSNTQIQICTSQYMSKRTHTYICTKSFWEYFGLFAQRTGKLTLYGENFFTATPKSFMKSAKSMWVNGIYGKRFLNLWIAHAIEFSRLDKHVHSCHWIAFAHNSFIYVATRHCKTKTTWFNKHFCNCWFSFLLEAMILWLWYSEWKFGIKRVHLQIGCIFLSVCGTISCSFHASHFARYRESMSGLVAFMAPKLLQANFIHSLKG